MKRVVISTLAAACVAAVLTFCATPDPTGWVLMIGGAGLLGLAVRRRRATSLA